MKLKKHLLPIFFICLYITIYGQEQSYIQYTAKDGLPTNNVYMGFQDSKGYMWFCTDAGLSRFNGYTFENFDIQDGLPDNDIFDILEDKQGRIWFASNNGKLGYIQDNVFHNSTNTFFLRGQDQNSYISCMYMDSKGFIWFGTRRNGILYLDTNNTFHKIPINENQSKNNTSYTFWENKDGDVYVLTGYAIQNLTKKETITLKSLDIKIGTRDSRHCEISLLDNGELLVTESSNFYILDKDYKKVLKKIKYNNLNTTTVLLTKDRSKTIWAGTYNGIFKLDLENEQLATPVDFLNGLTVSSRKEDTQGNLWFTTLEKGIYFLPNIKVMNYTVNNALPEVKVNAVDGNDKGDIIIGQEHYYSIIKDGKIQAFNKDACYKNKKIIPLNRHIYDVSLNNYGDYIITSSNGIIANKKDQDYYYSRVNRAAITYKKDSIIMGFNDLYKAKITELDTLSKPGNTPSIILKNLQINAIHWNEQDNSLWVGLIDGLIQIKDDKILNISNTYPSLKQNITDIKLSSKKNDIWISTNGKGIFLLDKNGKPKLNLTKENGLSSNICKALTEDKHGKLWIATNKGLNKVIDTKTNNITKYGVSDGLLNDNINDVFIHQNKLWVATPMGLSMMDISKEKNYNNPIYISNTLVNNVSKDFSKSMNTLSHKENNISIDFVSLDYIMGGDILYRYKIKENQDWNYTNTNRIEFSSLSSGRYAFVIQAKTKQGTWSKETAFLNFKINKPWWQTWWAYTLYFLGISSLMFAFFKYEIRKRKLKVDLLLEKEESQKFKELDEFKSQFFTNISHEIRTPLTLINGYISDLEIAYKADKRKEIQQDVDKQIKTITNMVDSVLDLAKMQSSNFNLELKSTNISHILKKIYLNFESLFNQKNIAFHIPKHTIDYFSLIDGVFFEKALNNLVINALKYTEKGEVSINYYKSNEQLIIKVIDTGIGIAESDIEPIFNRFHQINNDINASGGSGIGLAFCKEIIELHHGKISLKSELGKGSEFIISIPLEKSIPTVFSEKQTLKKVVDKTEILKAIESTNYHFLIVDDNDDMRAYLRSILKDYTCLEASNGLEAFDLISKNSINFIITDYMMPKLNGYELVVKLNENNNNIPIIMLTAKTGIGTKLEVLKLGIDDYITKPFDKNELLTRINNCIKNNTVRTSYNTEHNIIIDNNKKDNFIQELEAYIYENTNSPDLNQDTIIIEFNISKSSFYRKIKSKTGLSPNNFINEIRLQKARTILEKNPTILLKQVALEVGFSHTYHFSKLYKERFGVKPC